MSQYETTTDLDNALRVLKEACDLIELATNHLKDYIYEMPEDPLNTRHHGPDLDEEELNFD